MDKIKQKTPKHEAETYWNNCNKATLFYSHYYTVLNFAILIFACPIFRDSRNLVLAKLSENKGVISKMSVFKKCYCM